MREDPHQELILGFTRAYSSAGSLQSIPLIIQGVVAAAAGAQAGLSISQAVAGPPGPTDEENEAKRLQAEDKKELEKQQSEAEKQRLSRQKITAAAQGRRGVGTLFRRTGELGVKLGETGNIGGQSSGNPVL